MGYVIQEIRNLHHNHSATIAASHPSLRKLNFTSVITSEVERATKANIKPAEPNTSIDAEIRWSFMVNIFTLKKIYIS